MSQAPHASGRNQVAIAVAGFIGFMGFTLVMPFLPLYFRELGVTDVGEVALWSGVSLGITPAMTALLAPVWGRLADRFGRKVMVQRSLVSFIFVMIGTAYASQAWHVLALRAFQGFFSGYGALILTMAADSAPEGRMASAIGTAQGAQRLGPAVGPVIGGVIAQLVGLRQAFLVAAGLYAVALVLVQLLYQEPPTARGNAVSAGRRRMTVRGTLRFEHFGLFLLVIFGVQFVDKSVGPILPLFVADIGVPFDRVALVSGIVFSVIAAFGALGNYLGGQALERLATRDVIVWSAVLAIVPLAAFAMAAHPIWLLVAAPLLGLSVGTAMTATYAAAGSIIPAHARGTGFGVMTSALLSGGALSPMLSGALAAMSIRSIFVADGLALAVLAVVVSRTLARPRPSDARPTLGHDEAAETAARSRAAAALPVEGTRR